MQLPSSFDVDLLAIGEPLVAIAARWDGLLRLDPHLAGAETNVAVHVAKAGRRAMIVGRVGNDARGAFVRSRLEAASVDTRALIVESGRGTGAFVKEVDLATGEPRRAYARIGSAGSALGPGDLPTGVRARVHLVSGLTALLSESAASAAVEHLSGAQRSGAVAVLDVNLRPGLARSDNSSDALKKLAVHADLIVGGPTELGTIAGTVDVDARRDIAEAVAAHCGASAVLVRDAREAGLLEREGWTAEPGTAATQVIDTSGAGDAFLAGYLLAWWDGAPPAARLRHGHAAGAAQVATPGDCDAVLSAAR